MKYFLASSNTDSFHIRHIPGPRVGFAPYYCSSEASTTNKSLCITTAMPFQSISPLSPANVSDWLNIHKNYPALCMSLLPWFPDIMSSKVIYAFQS